ncbi:hypothetical protein MJG53_018579 [Ovis ammon polii x Ovis aries]|uniref:Uncharacterized protein n=1 Tax=Ovis ammon polii x Ovis aries TaxID=2918886 RepID=A0ACB9U463_9CETA|nr:hypothetical protein MJG53_018579 [Ovis ammon polii x Ovis aries]
MVPRSRSHWPVLSSTCSPAQGPSSHLIPAALLSSPGPLVHHGKLETQHKCFAKLKSHSANEANEWEVVTLASPGKSATHKKVCLQLITLVIAEQTQQKGEQEVTFCLGHVGDPAALYGGLILEAPPFEAQTGSHSWPYHPPPSLIPLSPADQQSKSWRFSPIFSPTASNFTIVPSGLLMSLTDQGAASRTSPLQGKSLTEGASQILGTNDNTLHQLKPPHPSHVEGPVSQRRLGLATYPNLHPSNLTIPRKEGNHDPETAAQESLLKRTIALLQGFTAALSALTLKSMAPGYHREQRQVAKLARIL